MDNLKSNGKNLPSSARLAPLPRLKARPDCRSRSEWMHLACPSCIPFAQTHLVSSVPYHDSVLLYCCLRGPFGVQTWLKMQAALLGARACLAAAVTEGASSELWFPASLLQPLWYRNNDGVEMLEFPPNFIYSNSNCSDLKGGWAVEVWGNI